MATTQTNPAHLITAPAGGGFLLADASVETVFTPEDLNEEQRQIESTADRFMTEEVVPRVADLEAQQPGLARKLMKQAADLGLLAAGVPEQYGGLEMDMTTGQVVAERCGRYASFSTTYGAHTHIGTLPLVYFGTEKQKQHYLPKLIGGEWIGAYCLSEPQAGSDALASRTRAELSADGKHYILNGEKMWISNGGWANLFTVFAKVDGEKFTAFLVERDWDGVKPGAEEKKMGIKGSSTTPLVLDNVAVPVENVLGEIGRGHVIAFNILNIGRLELGAACVGGAKSVIAVTIEYAKQRTAFGKPISDFGLIQAKLAQMAVRLYATESIVYRTSGMIDARSEGLNWTDGDAGAKHLKAIEEYAVECSIVKVYSSESLDYMVDEAVQVHGGYGFHQDYSVERSYRDSRVNRIFEGTNEINRLLMTGMLLKRAAQGRLDLMSGTQNALREAASGASRIDGSVPPERDILRRAKHAMLICAGAVYERFGDKIEEQQEVVAALSDIMIGIYAAESALLRSRKLSGRGRGECARDMARLLVYDLLAEARRHGLTVLAACGPDEKIVQACRLIARLTDRPPLDTIALRRRIAGRLIAAEKFVV
ncbi:MAG: acyl-CoA dehydrogenase family protein [Acidobacteria bacterium]|nr:acyl-CoA dehydrogenase family protein [Acidobacteriota bacterium]